MDIAQAIALGVVQGLTEFIPVSSSGHLQLIPDLFGWQSPGTTFILFTHIGTLLALLIFFRKDLWQYAKALFTLGKGSEENKQDFHLIFKIVLATIPAGVVGLLLESKIDAFYTDQTIFPIPALITAILMGVVGILFILADRWHRSHKRQLPQTRWVDAITIGLSQIFALIRGISRSGVTILTGQSLGLSRVAAAKFSFLMSIPILTATSVLAVYDLLKSEVLSQELILANILGMLAAFISGWWAIRFLLGYLQKHGLSSFGWYRVIVSIVVILIIAL
ncbi:MAG: undecaprenyl-diphosphate phosphatase [Candidatus Doudnabacteria bacterium]|nr:undecaprenyl-diphosphate phosphatase [Candidatus Doudnabacteria bacterium]